MPNLTTAQTSTAIPDRHGANLFLTDPSLAALLQIYLPGALYRHVEAVFVELGAAAGGPLDELAQLADRHPPTLKHRTRTGQDLQRIDKHPAYVELERMAFSRLGLAAMSHRAGVFDWPEALPKLVKYALTYVFVQSEFGLCCPLSMTDSLTGTLLKHGDQALIDRYLPELTTQDFDQLSQGAMFITEQGAGSDVSGVTTRAYRDGDGWKLQGEKWFCSNPDAALAMVLARADGAPPGMKGLGLFLMPRTLPDGCRNSYHIVRLKDKLGTRSMASGEIRLDGATAYPVGEIGRGFHNMATMINMSRLSNGVRAAGLMRRAVGEALFIARNRQAFNRHLIDMPLMQRTLIKMLLPSEQARTMFMHLSVCMGRADSGDQEAEKLVRILTPLIKFRACRDARKVTQDGMEVRGGCGYIEEWSDPRIVRDALLGSIWEGTSNIVALDVARSIQRDHTLPFLQRYLEHKLDHEHIPVRSRESLGKTLYQVVQLMQESAQAADDADTRRAATALYNITTAILMAWEAAQSGTDFRRLALAHGVLRHRILPQDPLGARAGAEEQRLVRQLLDETPLTLAEAMSAWLPTG
ncbi:acyl-CoA dehydrogenase family protein [Hydrogenophaga sp.]|uniref:acyl-CoA dehydrogenase family protein n=1 Tax=Hydrogenophaga sp. TaxID=1904254 RepID=UPI003565A153